MSGSFDLGTKAKEKKIQPAKTRIWPTVIIILVILAVAVVVVKFVWFSDKGPNTQGNIDGLLDTDNYQAVFLNNGQVYFGKLVIEGDWLTLSDVYYLQVDQQLQSSTPLSNTAQNFQLVKLGSEIHGPQDVMYIPVQSVNFWENLKDDSRAVEAIKKYKTQN